MSSLRRVQSSKSNGARSKGPSTPAGKRNSSLNAIRHGLCAKCIVVEGESRENFLILLQQHVDRFRPAGEVEFGMVEEMCAAYWRQRRAWSLETGMFNKQMALQPDAGMMDQMVVAFDTLAASPSLSLLHRYETRLHLMYQRALRTLIMLRTVDLPNDPSPISEHPEPVIPVPAPSPAPPTQPDSCQPPPPQPAADSEALGSACLSLPKLAHQPSAGALRSPVASVATGGDVPPVTQRDTISNTAPPHQQSHAGVATLPEPTPAEPYHQNHATAPRRRRRATRAHANRATPTELCRRHHANRASIVRECSAVLCGKMVIQ